MGKSSHSFQLDWFCQCPLPLTVERGVASWTDLRSFLKALYDVCTGTVKGFEPAQTWTVT